MSRNGRPWIVVELDVEALMVRYVERCRRRRAASSRSPCPKTSSRSWTPSRTRRDESRSHVIREAVAKYITAREKEDLDRQYEEGYRKFPEDIAELRAMEAASAESLKDDPW